MLSVRWLIQAGFQSGSIMGIADTLTQLVVDQSWDVHRTLRWSLVGATLHGPYFAAGFARLDAVFGAPRSMAVVAKKTAAAQLILFPPYLTMLFAYMGLLEGMDDVSAKVHQRVPEAFASGCVYWPIANAINFGLLPPSWRIPYLSVAAGAWNCYLSYMNALQLPPTPTKSTTSPK